MSADTPSTIVMPLTRLPRPEGLSALKGQRKKKRRGDITVEAGVTMEPRTRGYILVTEIVIQSKARSQDEPPPHQQRLDVIVDTGSHEMLLFSKDCKFVTQSERPSLESINLPPHPQRTAVTKGWILPESRPKLYDRDASGNYKLERKTEKWTDFGDGENSYGKMASDVMVVAGVTSRQQFMDVTISLDNSGKKIAGLIPMSWFTAKGKEWPSWHKIANKVGKHVFAVSVPRVGEQGQLMIGGWNEDHIQHGQTITWSPVVKHSDWKSHWLLQLKNISVGGTTTLVSIEVVAPRIRHDPDGSKTTWFSLTSTGYTCKLHLQLDSASY